MGAAIQSVAFAQTDWGSVFNKFKLEARFDAEVQNASSTSYGLHGRYFNLMVGGDLGNGFSYYFRQRLRAEEGSIHFFDNTDFLYVDYQASDNWRLRAGKDAMAVGGYEYDAPPIDEYFVSEYWNNLYCFQLAMSAAYTTDDGRQTFVAQVSQSPYLNSLGLPWNYGLLAYNIEWLGKLGDHVNTLWSTSMIERDRQGSTRHYMNLTMLGTQVCFDRWDAYLDLMHHMLDSDEWGQNIGYVFRLNYRLTPALTLFAKSSWERNESDRDMATIAWIDQMVPAGHTYSKNGLGVEYRPHGMESLRMHGYVAYLSDYNKSLDQSVEGVAVNIGLTWTMDFHQLMKK